MPVTRVRNTDLTDMLQALLIRAEPKVNSFNIGQENNSSVSLVFRTTALATTAIRYNISTSKFELSHNGTTFSEIVTAAYPNLHAQNTDTGTNQNDFSIGNGNPTDKTIYFNVGGTNPYVRYDTSLERIIISNDGVSEVELGVDRLVFPALLANQNGDYGGRIIPAETEITFGGFPTETAFNPQKDSFIHVQMIVELPSVRWVNAESVIEFRQDPITKQISLFNQSEDPVEIRMFVDPI